jgi:hypothetical protein
MLNTRTPRVQITLKPATRAIFSRLSAAQDRPEATLIAEFLDETAPALQNVVAVVERAKNIVSMVGQQERERYAVAESQLLEIMNDSLANLDKADTVISQLSLDLGKTRSASPSPGEQAGFPRLRSSGKRQPDPTGTNRGVNMRKKSTGTRSTK